jgi:hypothetical protein
VELNGCFTIAVLIYVMLLTVISSTAAIQRAVSLLFRGNNGYANAPQYCVTSA